MPRTQPTEYVDRIGVLDMEPLDSVGEYLTSKENNKIFLKPPPTRAAEDLESFYLQEKLQHQIVMKMMNEHQANKVQHKAKIDYQLSKTAKDALELRAKFVDINAIARDLNERKKSSMKKISYEVEKQEKFVAEINEKLEKYEALKKFKKIFKASNDEHELYESVLQDVIEIAGIPSIKDLTERCDAIMLAQTEIVQMNSKQLQSILKMRNKMVATIKKTELVYVGLKNELDQMNHFYRMAMQDCLRWERIFRKSTDAVIDFRLKKGMVKEGINNLYNLLCRRKNIKPIYQRSEVENCLRFILTEIRLMRDIIEEYNNPKMGKNVKRDVCSAVK